MKPQPLAKSQILTYSSHQVTAAPAPQLDSEETLGLNTTRPPSTPQCFSLILNPAGENFVVCVELWQEA